jgi:hypothetical protein
MSVGVDALRGVNRAHPRAGSQAQAMAVRRANPGHRTPALLEEPVGEGQADEGDEEENRSAGEEQERKRAPLDPDEQPNEESHPSRIHRG